VVHETTGRSRGWPRSARRIGRRGPRDRGTRLAKADGERSGRGRPSALL